MLLTAIALKRFSILSPDFAETSQYPAFHSFASSSPSSSVTYLHQINLYLLNLLSSKSILFPTRNNKISFPFYSSTIFFHIFALKNVMLSKTINLNRENLYL